MLLNVIPNKAGVSRLVVTQTHKVVETTQLSLTGAMTGIVCAMLVTAQRDAPGGEGQGRARSGGEKERAPRGGSKAPGAPQGEARRIYQAAASGRRLQLNVDDCWWFLLV